MWFLRTVHGTELEWRLCFGSVATSNICSRQDAPAFSWDGACPTGTKKACLAWRRDARRTRRPQALSGPKRTCLSQDTLFRFSLRFFNSSSFLYLLSMPSFSETHFSLASFLRKFAFLGGLCFLVRFRKGWWSAHLFAQTCACTDQDITKFAFDHLYPRFHLFILVPLVLYWHKILPIRETATVHELC